MKPRTGLHARLLAAALVAVLAVGALACGDDDAQDVSVLDDSTTAETDIETPSTQRDQDRDRDRDQDRIHQVVDEVTEACRVGDQDRLRQYVTDQVRDRLRDGSCLLPEADESTVEDLTVEDMTVEIDGDTAQVRFTYRYRHQGDKADAPQTWRFRWTNENGWLLDDMGLIEEDG